MISKQNTKNGMYEIHFSDILLDKSLIHPILSVKPITKQANNLYHLTKMKGVFTYLHQYCFSPKTSTWCVAIDKGFFQSWPHLTSKLVKKYLPLEEATVKGHQHQSPKNLWSIKPKPETNPMNKSITVIPQIHKITNKIYTDQTGKFPHKSSKGKQYVMVAYLYKANAILAEPLKNRTGVSLLETYQNIYSTLSSSGLFPKLYILYNEASSEF